VQEKTRKPLLFSKTVAPPPPPTRAARGAAGRPRALPLERLLAVPDEGLGERGYEPRQAAEDSPGHAVRLEPLVREWLLDLQVLGRSRTTIDWYAQKMRWYLEHGEARTLGELTAFELKRYLAELQSRGLSDNTVHGAFETLRALSNWASREGYPVDPALLRVRAPKVAQKEMETYSAEQQQVVLRAAPAGWARMAVAILLGTGMRAGELCALSLDDLEDDGESTFLKIRRGKGAKFRRVPVSHQLRRELVRYVNRTRPECSSELLLVLRDGRPISVACVSRFFQRLHRRVGFRVHAHKFRHTFATEYLRRGGEIERLRRILGHTTYVMVMRYVHLDKGDLYRDFDQCAPF
jgi:integrase/recombinase XerD